MNVHDLITLLDLKPHPEGGYYRESHRAKGSIAAAVLPKGFMGPRNFSTAIYYLLDGDARSRLHRLASDEVWHFYAGDPLVVAEIAPSGLVIETTLGPDLAVGQALQHVVPAGNWFGAYRTTNAGYSLVGCTVAPGFDFADFELTDREALLQQFPQASTIITRLT